MPTGMEGATFGYPTEYLQKIKLITAKYIQENFPKLADDWWLKCVYEKVGHSLATNRLTKDKNDLDSLDLLSLLKILAKNWDALCHRSNIGIDKQHMGFTLIHDMKMVRHATSHWTTNTRIVSPLEDLYRDIDTTERYLLFIAPGTDFIKDVRKRKDELLTLLYEQLTSNKQIDNEVVRGEGQDRQRCLALAGILVPNISKKENDKIGIISWSFFVDQFGELINMPPGFSNEKYWAITKQFDKKNLLIKPFDSQDLNEFPAQEDGFVLTSNDGKSTLNIHRSPVPDKYAGLYKLKKEKNFSLSDGWKVVGRPDYENPATNQADICINELDNPEGTAWNENSHYVGQVYRGALNFSRRHFQVKLQEDRLIISVERGKPNVYFSQNGTDFNMLNHGSIAQIPIGGSVIAGSYLFIYK